jgi:PAS domain-containing protein
MSKRLRRSVELCSVVTDRAGRIVDLNAPAAELLKIKPAGLERHPRTFEVFFSGSRPAILGAQSAATPTPSAPIPVVVRPRDHGPRPAVITVQEASDGYLEWTIHPSRRTAS